MPNVFIRNLDEQTIVALKRHAARNNRSLQAELKDIVERAAAMDMLDSREVAERIRRKLSDRRFSDSTALVAEDRNR